MYVSRHKKDWRSKTADASEARPAITTDRQAPLFSCRMSSSRVCLMGRSRQAERKSGDGGAPPANYR
ncbi:hypothetical protein J6590_057808 [Homalodisca vitripennis]|nr:hypothetical protein J6590_057808 [Homalodisca vitripennis]